MNYSSRSKAKRVPILPIIIALVAILLLSTYIVVRLQTQNASSRASTKGAAIIGAIRFDAWSDTDYRWFPTGGFRRLYSDYLAPEQWNYRLPFFAKVIAPNKVTMNGDTQEVVDKEIQAAAKGGLDYWAFNFSNLYWRNDPTVEAAKKSNHNYALRRYLASKYKNQLNFALTLFSGEQKPGDNPSTYWRTNTVPELIKYIKDPSYQKVLGDRPLVYIFDAGAFQTRQGSTSKEDINSIRTQVKAAGFNNPYIVGMVWQADDPVIKSLGFDAVSAYSAPEFGTATFTSGKPYSDLVNANLSFWNTGRKTGADVVPIVNTGWDRRPHWIDSEEAHNPWYKMATPQQVAQNLKNAIDWNKANAASAPANVILMYAWNEYGEGGWLSPNLQTGADRLDAIEKVINRPVPEVLKSGMSANANGNVYVWVQGNNFSRELKVQLYDTDKKTWGSSIPFTLNSTGGNFALPVLAPPSTCTKTQQCMITAVFQDASSSVELTKITFTLATASGTKGITALADSFTGQGGPLVVGAKITSVSLARAFSPWYVSLSGTSLSLSLKARLVDVTGAQWGSDIAVGSPLDLSILTFQLPANMPPSKCNNGKTCAISLYLVDSQGRRSSEYKLLLPAN